VQARPGARCRPTNGAPCDLGHDPITERIDEARRFRDRDELPGTEQAAGRVLPARERLKRDGRAGPGAADGLEVQQQLVALDRATELRRQLKLCGSGPPIGGRTLRRAVATLPSAVDGGGRATKELLSAAGVRREECNADAPTQWNLVTRTLERRGERVAEHRCDLVGAHRRLALDVADEYAELVTGASGEKILGADAPRSRVVSARSTVSAGPRPRASSICRRPSMSSCTTATARPLHRARATERDAWSSSTSRFGRSVTGS
jgi:hypothetical protein